MYYGVLAIIGLPLNAEMQALVDKHYDWFYGGIMFSVLIPTLLWLGITFWQTGNKELAVAGAGTVFVYLLDRGTKAIRKPVQKLARWAGV
jgi:hypothetical protein